MEAGVEPVARGAPLVLLGEERVFRVVLVGGRDEALCEGGKRSSAGGVRLGVWRAKLDGAELWVGPDVPPAPGVVRDACRADQGVYVALKVSPRPEAGR
jgi:hypothetical protein